jgi:polar amino acid transport system substrate-binding protein
MPCERPLIMGWEPWEPYQFRDAEGEVAGFDIELMRAVLERMGCGLELREIPWSRHLRELERGTVDLAAGVTRTDEREEFAYFSAPYREDTIALWIRAADAGSFHFTDLADLAGSAFRLGITRDYNYGGAYAGLLADPEFDPGQLQEVNTEEQNYDKLLKGRIDGFLADPANVRVYLRDHGLEGKIVPHPVPVFASWSFVMFSKKTVTPELVDAFDRALAVVRRDGAYDQIRAKYF